VVIRVAVVHHSGFGHTARLAKAVAFGADSVPGVTSESYDVGQAPYPFEALAGADAIVFGCPTYMGSASAPFKAFMDASSRAAYLPRAWRDKLAAGFTNSGCQSGDKLSTLTQLAVFAAQHGMVWVGLDVPTGNCTRKGTSEDLNRLGSWLGAMAQSNLDAEPDAGPPPSDLATAEALGRRVSEAARRWRFGLASTVASALGQAPSTQERTAS
jgi:multimeric flavodoxin WrbA